MIGLLTRIRMAGAWIWIKLVQYMNRIVLAVVGVAAAVNTMYPSAVTELAATMSPGHKLLMLAVFSSIVEYGLHNAAKKS